MLTNTKLANINYRDSQNMYFACRQRQQMVAGILNALIITYLKQQTKYLVLLI